MSEPADPIRFDGRVVVITGACGGLGRAYASAFAARGARLVLNDIGARMDGTAADAGLADTLAAQLRAQGAEAIGDASDIAGPDAAAGLIEKTMDAYGQVDVLINNAGNMRNGAFKKMAPADFDAVLAVHLQGVAYLTQAAFAQMVARNYGRIVMTTSAGGLYGAFGVANYAAGKTGLIGLMNAVKVEGARHGVRANALAPIAVSRMLEGVLADDADMERAFPSSGAVAGALYLASERCQTSGEILVAAGRHFARVEIRESLGVHLPPDVAPTPELIAARYGDIADMTGAVTPYDLAAAIEKAADVAVAGGA